MPHSAAPTRAGSTMASACRASLEEDEGWAGEFIAACDHVVDQR